MTKRKGKTNYDLVLSYIKENFPNNSIESLCDEFGYKDYIKGLLIMDEDTFSSSYPEIYKLIQSFYNNIRKDSRTEFDTCRDICSNFIIEDILVNMINSNYESVSISLNEEEHRDIEKHASNLPDFIFKNKDNGKTIPFDLKIDWGGRFLKEKKYFFRGNEIVDYAKYGALALIWSPNKNKFTFLDFRSPVDGEIGIDERKGGKQGFWADLWDNKFGEIYMKDGAIYLDEILKKLCKLSNR